MKTEDRKELLSKIADLTAENEQLRTMLEKEEGVTKLRASFPTTCGLCQRQTMSWSFERNVCASCADWMERWPDAFGEMPLLSHVLNR